MRILSYRAGHFRYQDSRSFVDECSVTLLESASGLRGLSARVLASAWAFIPPSM